MDKASRALAEPLRKGIPDTIPARAAYFDVPLATLYAREHKRPSREDKARSQQYLHPYEEKAVSDFLTQAGTLGRPVRIKYIPALAFSATRHRPESDRPPKSPHCNWAKRFEKRRTEFVARKNKPQDWNRFNICDKVVNWFEVIREELRKLDILPENDYNMDETRMMLSMLNSVKVLVGKHDMQRYRGARVKRTMITAVECISGDGRCLGPMIIWPASTHRAN